MPRFSVRPLLIALLLGTASAAAVPMLSYAQEAAAANRVKPLMIIRFNQPTVRYERALQSAVARATHAKPDVRFTLVSFAPSYGDAGTQKQLADRSAALLNQVREQIVSQGVMSDRIETVTRNSNAITHSEVHILVR